MIWLSETYLDSSYAGDDTRLNLKDFTLIGADNPRNCKIGGVVNSQCYYFVLSLKSTYSWTSIYFAKFVLLHWYDLYQSK